MPFAQRRFTRAGFGGRPAGGCYPATHKRKRRVWCVGAAWPRTSAGPGRGLRAGTVLVRAVGSAASRDLERISAAARERRRRREATRARLKALREAGRPKEHNTAASLPAWVP